MNDYYNWVQFSTMKKQPSALTFHFPFVVDGVWTAWLPWMPMGQCSVSCGGGSQTYNRSRTCTGQLFGGNPCPGDAIEFEARACNDDPCPGTYYSDIEYFFDILKNMYHQ